MTFEEWNEANPPCCNPKHLFLGTFTDNNRDRDLKGRNANCSKTRCKKGHTFAEHGRVYVYPNGKRQRKCVTCHRADAVAQRERNRELKSI